MCSESLETKYNELSEFIDDTENKEDKLFILIKAQDIFGYLPKEVQNYITKIRSFRNRNSKIGKK